MSAERWLQISVALLSILGAMLLGLEHQQSTLPLLVIFAAITSVCFTDILGWFKLNRFVVNIAAVAAMIFSVYEFLQSVDDNLGQLHAIANLLVYWQIVMLYQEKNGSVYALLLMLSLLEVVVGAVLNVGFFFGLLLMLYVLLALPAMTFFFLYQIGQRLQRNMGPSSAKHDKVQRSLGRQPAWLQLLGAPARAYQEGSTAAFSGAMPFRGMLQQLLVVTVATFIFATLFFYSMPREQHTTWRKSPAREHASVGFSREVSLDEMGKILQSDKLVMRVDFYDSKRKPYLIYGEPYFRGRVLDTYAYEYGQAKWIRSHAVISRSYEFDAPPTDRDVVRQEFWVEPTDRRLLFAVHPCFRVPETPGDVRYNRRSLEVYRSRTEHPLQYHYVLGTTAFNNGVQLSVLPAQSPYDRAGENERRLDVERFPTLVRTAQEIVDTAGMAGSGTIIRARILQNHFRNQGLYHYTLDFTRHRRNHGLDPIEDFVANHRTGHCEYFASALVMMLRSQGIPARMVVGYKGGQYNTVGNFYQVRERDAHAWVEAYLEPEEVPIDTSGLREVPYGAWLRLDPTPVSADPIPAPDLLDKLADTFAYAQVLWSEYVVGLDPQRQRHALLSPVNAILDIPELKAWSASFSMFTRAWINRIKWWLGGHWFSWRAGVAAMLLCCLCLASFHALTSLWRRRGLWRRRQANESHQRRSVQVDFYQRLENLLATLDVYRSSNQTQREFATGVGQILDGRLRRETAPLLGQLIEAFYQVRFGRANLNAAQQEEVNQTLARLEHLIRDGHQEEVR